MATLFRHRLRPLMMVAASLALMVMVRGESGQRQSASSPDKHVTVADEYYPLVHLRKLHLVRPDLIPYPVYYAIYC